VVQLSAGWTHACLLTDGGDVWCWGQNPRLTPTPTNLPPTRVELPPATRLASGDRTTCALVQGDVWCFGTNATVFNAAAQPDGGTWGARMVDAGVRFDDLIGGGATLCGLNRDGGLLCWGSNASGALGRGFASAQSLQPRAPDGGSAWAFASSGQQHTCALDPARRAWCWGYSFPFVSTSAFPVDGGLAFSTLSAGFQHTCGVEAASSVAWCWGSNVSSQLGVSSSVASGVLAPVAVDGGARFMAVSAGNGFTCGLDDAGVASCWGANGVNQLGRTGAASPVPTPIASSLRFSTLASGDSFTCGLGVDGRVWCWGFNTNLQLGSAGLTQSAVPLEVLP
jgi:alpha-tubulin suppressor-like RCC1 family protein